MNASQPARRVPLSTSLGSILVIVAALGALAPGIVSAQSPGEASAADPSERPWRRAEAPFVPAGLALWDVIAGGPGFIAVGGGFELGKEVGTAAIWVSEDGREWQSVPLFGNAGEGIPRSITATPDGFVAVGSGCCPDRAAVWLSSDGLVWERLPDQPGFADTAMLSVSAASDGVVAVGCSAVLECSAGLSWTSPDGRSWSEPVPLDLLAGGVTGTSAGLLALGATEVDEGSAALATSMDGTTWSAVTDLEVDGWLEPAAEGPEGILAAGGGTDDRSGKSQTLAYLSADGQAWESVEVEGVGDVWVEDLVATPAGWLLAGWSTSRIGQLPATLWSQDLLEFQRLPFPREVKEGGMLHGAAVSADGTTLVAVGSTMLNRGEVPTAWVRGMPAG